MWNEDGTGAYSIAISTLRTLCIDRSGQYIANDDASLLIPTSRFTNLIEYEVLPLVNKFRPRVKQFNITIGQSPYIFSTSDEYGIPINVSNVTPLIGVGATGYIINNAMMKKYGLVPDADLAIIPSEYLRPNLHVNVTGEFTIRGLFPATVSDTSLINVEEGNKSLITELAYGLFMKSLGMKRGAVQETDFPIVFNYQEVFAEGEKVWDQAVADLEATGKWWLAWRR